jgi:O-acetyl-ADP-ribose deacetylase (regulator of RNase III)
MRFREIVDIIDNLYKLSVRIRQPTIRSRSLKAASYAPKDPDTKVDVLEQYSNFDLQHTQELVRHLRMPYVNSGDAQEDDALVNRLARAVTLRRRQFKYWKRHRDKLGISTILEDAPAKPQDARPDTINRHNTLEVQVSTPEQTTLKDATSEKTGRMTLLSGTEATHHHQSLDDIVDSKSVTSYATTVRDASGRSLQLPPPPKAADGEKDFECSICYTICPSRYANQRSWQVHVLQDLQPYVCTYPECDIPDQLFQRRRHWVEHEAGHRKAWRCPEHPDAVYKTAAGLRGHLLQRHGDSFPGSQLDSIVKVGETSTVDLRNCPICYAPSDSKEIANHIANHLERIAIFALPTTMHDHSEGASSRASRGTDNTYSQDLSGVSFNSDRSDAPSKSIIHDTVEEATSPMDTETLSASASGNREPPAELGLSAELLNRLPNAIQERLDILFAHQPSGSGDVSRPDDEDNEPEKLTSSADEESLSDLSVSVFYEAIKSKDRPSVLTASELPTLRKLYLSKLLTPRAETYAPDDRHNQIISFYNHDITRLKMDAIVNSANCSLGASNPSSSLNHIIHKAAGPDMARECKAHPRIKVGQATITAGYNLPCTHVIHTARPNYRGNRLPRRLEELAECYRSVLELAMNHNLRTIAFPAVGSGGCGFPPRVAARIALTTVREFLDSHPSHSFQMIAFCVFSGIDEEAYTNSLPVYFPPTQGDLESATPNKPGASITVLRAQVLDACIQTEAVLQKLGNFRRHVAAFPGAVLEHLTKIMHALRSLRTALLNNNQGIFLGTTKQSKTLDERTIEHVILICTAMKTVAGSITEITEVAKGKAALSQQNHQAIWDDYNEYMRTSQGLNVVGLLELCQDFAQCLEDVIVR